MAQTRLPVIRCSTCGKQFTPTRGWQKFCRPACRKQALYEDRMAEYVCEYCGLVGETIDHIPPRAVRPSIVELGLAARYPSHEVRACHECNSALGDRPLWTVAKRKEFIKKRLRRKYKKFLDIPDWSDVELAKLEDGMRGYVLHGLAVRDLVRQRLKH